MTDGAAAVCRVTGAIKATVSAAYFAAFLQLGAETLAGAMQPNVQIIYCQTERGRGLLGGRTVEVDSLQQVLILLRQAGQQPLHALAEESFGRGIGFFGKLRSQPFERTVANNVPTIDVDDGAAQNAIEPRHDIFVRSRLAIGAQSFQKALLHDVFGQMRVSDALPGERHKGSQVFQQRLFDVTHGAILATLRARSNPERPGHD